MIQSIRGTMNFAKIDKHLQGRDITLYIFRMLIALMQI